MKAKMLFKSAQLLKAFPFMLGHVDYIPTALHAISELKKDKNSHPMMFALPSNPFATEEEKEDLVGRLNWLLDNVIVEPKKLIDSMPSVIGLYYQGQWAIYAAVMTAVAACNIVRIYPDLKSQYLPKVPKIVDIIMSPELKHYDASSFHEDPLTSLDGNKSHMTYLSLLAWTLSCYKMAGGDNRYDELFGKICATLARRMRRSRDLNLPSFPNGIVFLPDMLVTIVALKNYGRIYNGEYDELVAQWVEAAREKWIDKRTNMLISQYYKNGRRSPMHGSYAGLNCTYLAMVDPEFAHEQYLLLKHHFIKPGKYVAVKEFLYKSPALSFNIDAGPIIEGLSPSGTAFALGAATYFEDWHTREGLLRTAELAGNTKTKGNKRHYKLAEMMMTGEAITLAMRTTKSLFPNFC